MPRSDNHWPLAAELEELGSQKAAHAVRELGTEGHTHLDKDGVIHKCFHHCRVSGRQWVFGFLIWTAGFPIEHFIWEKLPVFSNISNALGL